MPSGQPSTAQGSAVPNDAPVVNPSSRRTSALVLALLLLFAGAVQVGHVARYRRISPIDELQHLDYLIRVPRGQIPGSGDQFGQDSLRIETCSRLDEGFDQQVPPCVTDPAVTLDPAVFQEGGYNTAYIHPPTYYLVDGLVARAIDAVVPGDQSLLTTGRLAGLVWALAAVVFLWLLLAEVGAGLLARAALIVIVVSAPTILHATSTVNPDGSAVAVGAAILWAVLRWERGRLAAWVPIVCAVAVAATKVTNLAATGVVVGYLLVGALTERRAAAAGARRWDRQRPWGSLADRVRMALGIVLVTMVVAGMWAVAQKLLEEVPPETLPMSVRTAASSFPIAELASSWHQTVSPLRGPYLAPFLRTTPVTVMAGLVDLALMVGAVVGTVLAPAGSRARRLGAVVLAMTVLLPPVLVVFNALVPKVYVVIPPRYGISLVPALVAAAVPLVRRRSWGYATSVVAVLAGGAVVAALAFPAT